MKERLPRSSVSMIVQNNVVDSTRWFEYPFRRDDIVIDTFGKTGTTWVQQIVGQLIFQGAGDVPVGAISPWIEYRGVPWRHVLELLHGQKHRRFVKSHLPRQALPSCSEAQYIYVARDARDQIWSAHSHMMNLKPSALALKGRQIMGQRVSSIDVREFYNALMDQEDKQAWPYWSHVLSWWRVRHRSNVLLVHFSDLKSDLRAEIWRIAEFLRIDVSGGLMEKVLEHSEFDYMKLNSKVFAGPGTSALRNGPSSLINKGTNQRWTSMLTADEIAKCDKVAARHLPLECAAWLKAGRSSGVWLCPSSRRTRRSAPIESTAD